MEARYFDAEEVLDNTSFFYVGRGGHALTHPGNNRVRETVRAKTVNYLELPRNHRSKVAKELIGPGGELHDVRFVIPRDNVLSNLEHDEQDQRNNPNSKHPRRVGKARLKSLLSAHGSLEEIRSYPFGVCITVGTGWATDILNHMLREDADIGRRILHDLAAEGRPHTTKSSESRAPGNEERQTGSRKREWGSSLSEPASMERQTGSRERDWGSSLSEPASMETPIEIGLPLRDDGIEAIENLFSSLFGPSTQTPDWRDDDGNSRKRYRRTESEP